MIFFFLFSDFFASYELCGHLLSREKTDQASLVGVQLVIRSNSICPLTKFYKILLITAVLLRKLTLSKKKLTFSPADCKPLEQ